MELSLESYRVVKSNLFVEARYDWSTQMHRITMMALAQTRKDEHEFGLQRIYVRDLAALSDINTGQIYQEAEKACSMLLGQRIEIRGPGGEYHGYNLMSDTHFYPGKGYLEVRFNPNMKPFLLQLKERFTQYMLRQVMQLSSPYSIRFYELCNRWADIGWFDLAVDDLRLMFRLEHKYQQTTDLRRRVIDSARKELKTKANLYFDYSQVKRGRAIIGFKFRVVRKPKAAAKTAGKRNRKTGAPAPDELDLEIKAFRAYLATLTPVEREAYEAEALTRVLCELPGVDAWNEAARQSIVEEKMFQLWQDREIEAPCS